MLSAIFMTSMTQTMDQIVALCKRRGFIYPAGEIYGGLRGFWDYGPLGAKLKKNIRDAWWREMITCAPIDPDGRKPIQILPIDGSIITNPNVWIASGHVDRFKDCFLINRKTREMVREDEVQARPDKSDFENPRDINLLFETECGVVEGDKTRTYLRPETAQSIFINFANIINTNRVKLPFGVAQIGKAFRNEVTPRNFTYRAREFEQMEIEWFFNPKNNAAQTWFEFWLNIRMQWWEGLGLDPDKLSTRQHTQDELAHYAKDGSGVIDIMYEFPFGLGEIEGIAHRTDFDLKQHSEKSGTTLDFFDQPNEEKLFPHVIEPSAGLDRAVLAVLCDAYTVDENRPCKEFMAIAPRIAPIQAAFFPLEKRGGQPDLAFQLFSHYRRKYDCVYEEKGHIGKRYARMDEIGTPFCITIDGGSISDDTVTVRDRDTGEQQRMDLEALEGFLSQNLW